MLSLLISQFCILFIEIISFIKGCMCVFVCKSTFACFGRIVHVQIFYLFFVNKAVNFFSHILLSNAMKVKAYFHAQSQAMTLNLPVQTWGWMRHVSHVGLGTLGVPRAAHYTAPPPGGASGAVPHVSDTVSLGQVPEGLPQKRRDLLQHQTSSHFQGIWTLGPLFIHST